MERCGKKTGWCFWPGCASLQYAFGVGACLDGTMSGWWWWTRYDTTLSSYDGAPSIGSGSTDGTRGTASSPETFASAGERDSGHFNINTRTNKSKYKFSFYIYFF